MTGIIDLIGLSCLHIRRWQARLGELGRHAGPEPHPELAETWDTVASLIDLHMAAEDEICGPAIYSPQPQDGALSWQVKDAHEDIREILRETHLQPVGSLPWRQLATTALSAWARQLECEEHALPASCRHHANRVLPDQLTLQWRAFNEACIRDLDLYRDAPPQLPTCQLRLIRPAAPRLAAPVFGSLACTCQACTQALAAAIPILTSPVT